MLIPVSERIWVVPGGVNIGVLLTDDDRVVLVDTGLNESNAKRALKIVRDELGGEVTAILTTHAHADHFGGNATVVKRTGAAVHAPAFDEAFLRYPQLQPSLLFGGADPLDTMRGGFLLADPSPVDAIVRPGPYEIAGIALEAIPLFGHSPGQLGYLVGDIFFTADVVLPAAALEKYRIPYLYSLTDHLVALERARVTSHRVAVPGHGPLLHDGELDRAIDDNTELANRVLTTILEVTATPQSTEAVMHALLNRFDAPVADAPSYYLLQPTVFAFLSHLHREKLIEHAVRDRQSVWSRT